MTSVLTIIVRLFSPCSEDIFRVDLIVKDSVILWGKIRQVYPPKNFLSPISLKVREIIVLVNLFQFP